MRGFETAGAAMAGVKMRRGERGEAKSRVQEKDVAERVLLFMLGRGEAAPHGSAVRQRLARMGNMERAPFPERATARSRLQK